MAGLVTKETDRDVNAYLESLDSKKRQVEGQQLLELIEDVTGESARIWGNEKVSDFLIGSAKFSYRRKGGKEDFEWFKLGFAPRKSKITIYFTADLSAETELLARLGKCKWGKGCLYINKLEDIDLSVLKSLMQKSLQS